jgi:3-methyl-2-oxobutanoate hydroxymethyltransferase
MSVTQLRDPLAPEQKVTSQTLLARKQANTPITALTAYDYATARLVDDAGIDILLVGDSLAQVVLGYDSTLPVTMEEMLHHTRAVRRAVRKAMLVADMPYGSYQVEVAEGVRNAARFVKEAGAEAVKVEGGRNRLELIERMGDAEIPVVGHLGLTPQSVHRMGGYRVQGKTAAAIRRLREDALALERAGVIAIVLEGIPREVAARITRELTIPTIGIGAGSSCDGQILVLNDLLNLSFTPPAKFVRRYADIGEVISAAVRHYREDVLSRAFPAENESYHLTGDLGNVLLEEAKVAERNVVKLAARRKA